MADLPEPISKEDVYLKYIAENCLNGGGGSGIPLPVSIENGGTGAVDVTNARTNLEIYSKTELDSKLNVTVPITQGGTGATNVTDARTNLETYSKTEVDNIKNNLELGLNLLELWTGEASMYTNIGYTIPPGFDVKLLLIMVSQYTDRYAQSYLLPFIDKYLDSSFKHRVYVNTTQYLDFHFTSKEGIAVETGTGFITEIYGLS